MERILRRVVPASQLLRHVGTAFQYYSSNRKSLFGFLVLLVERKKPLRPIAGREAFEAPVVPPTFCRLLPTALLRGAVRGPPTALSGGLLRSTGPLAPSGARCAERIEGAVRVVARAQHTSAPCSGEARRRAPPRAARACARGEPAKRRPPGSPGTPRR